MEEVAAALDALQYGGHLDDGPVAGEASGGSSPTPATATTALLTPVTVAEGLPNTPGTATSTTTAEHPAAAAAEAPASSLGLEGPCGPCLESQQSKDAATTDGPDRAGQDGPQAMAPFTGPGNSRVDGPEREEDDAYDGIDALFCSPPSPILSQAPARRPRQRRTFDMQAVRRSARLARKPAVPAVEKAQRNLCRKLGLAEEETAPLETVLAEFIGMFKRPLPERILAALTTIFGLEDDGAEMLNDALLEYAGGGADDLVGDDGLAMV
ncbi:unnamed protein product [Urochloa humidicola]